tara:strand:+ start:1008 stop:1337 length:330 start_codon:yes stop_codon:yes gene_type:complete
MKKRIASLMIIMSLLVTPVLANPSGQHSANAVDHSGQAASQGSAAVLSGVAVVTSMPIMAVGSVLAISGVGLQSVGKEICLLGDELNCPALGQVAPTQGVKPNGPPALD